MNEREFELLMEKLEEIRCGIIDVETEAQGIKELAQQHLTQAASTHPQMPPSCAECKVLKPCELQYFSDKCFNRLRRHFLLA